MWLAPREGVTLGSAGHEGRVQVGARRERILLFSKQTVRVILRSLYVVFLHLKTEHDGAFLIKSLYNEGLR